MDHAFSAALINKLGGVHQAQRLLRGELEIVETELGALPVWKIVEFGANTRRHHLLHHDIKSRGIMMSKWSEDTVTKTKLSNTRRTIKLAMVSFRQLGIRRKRTTLASVLNQVCSHGLSLCPEETAIQLCLQHPNLFQRGQSLLVLSQPVRDSIGVSNLYSLDGLADGNWLNVNYIKPNSHLHDFQPLILAYDTVRL